MPNISYSSVKVENDLVDFLSKCTMATKPDPSSNHVKCDNTLCLASSSLDCVPPSILQMKVLTSLVLDHNDIEVIPEELCESLPNLQKFSMTGNELQTLPEKIGCWTQLAELHLTENSLVNLPPSICELRHLKVLKLIGNKLKKLPNDVDRLTSLQELYLGENCLCKVPDSFGLLGNLLILEVNDNKLSSLPETFGGLRKVRLLNLNSNNLYGLPESLSELECLEELDISNNNIELLPCEFKSAHLLRKLYADCNQICDIPAWFKTLRNLEELSLQDNRLQYGPFPEEFGVVCEQLRKYDLGGNFMSRLCNSFGNLKRLEFMHVGSVIGELERRNFQNGNWLTRLPENFGQLTLLREAHLDENQLTELPSNFGDLANLEILDLGQNLLQLLPESFSNLHSLRTCQLSKNKLLRLPTNFCDLTKLEDLRLDNNELSDVPDLSSLHKLKILDLFNNNLTKIPDGLAALTNLYSLDLDENDLGLSIMEIPQIAFRATYAPRDPALKGNWRGRARQDLLNLQAAEVAILAIKGDLGQQLVPHGTLLLLVRGVFSTLLSFPILWGVNVFIKLAKLQHSTSRNIPENKGNLKHSQRWPPPIDTQIASFIEVKNDISELSTDEVKTSVTATLKNALEQGSALWQKHGEAKKREKFVRVGQRIFPPLHNGVGEDADENEENWDDEITESQSTEATSSSLTGDEQYDLNTLAAQNEDTTNQAQAMVEDWDKELEELYPSPYVEEEEPITYHPVPDPMNMHAYIGQDSFCPSDIHAKPVRKYFRENAYYMGQFEDAD